MHVEEMYTFFANDLCCFRRGSPPFSSSVRPAPTLSLDYNAHGCAGQDQTVIRQHPL